MDERLKEREREKEGGIHPENPSSNFELKDGEWVERGGDELKSRNVRGFWLELTPGGTDFSVAWRFRESGLERGYFGICARPLKEGRGVWQISPLSCSEGFTELGYYNGTVSQTDSGSPCLKWTEFPDYVQQYPGRGLGGHNYCRNPDRESNPWCFFRQSSGAIGWAYCDCHQAFPSFCLSVCAPACQSFLRPPVCKPLTLSVSPPPRQPVILSAHPCFLIRAARLVGGSSAKSGRLEVYLNGQWGAVCDTHWTDRDASVICRQLGLGENVRGREAEGMLRGDIGTALQNSHFGQGSGIFHYERLGCRGNEASILQCQSRKFVTSDCNHGNEAGVVCAPPEGEKVWCGLELNRGARHGRNLVRTCRSLTCLCSRVTASLTPPCIERRERFRMRALGVDFSQLGCHFPSPTHVCWGGTENYRSKTLSLTAVTLLKHIYLRLPVREEMGGRKAHIFSTAVNNSACDISGERGEALSALGALIGRVPRPSISPPMPSVRRSLDRHRPSQRPCPDTAPLVLLMRAHSAPFGNPSVLMHRIVSAIVVAVAGVVVALVAVEKPDPVLCHSSCALWCACNGAPLRLVDGLEEFEGRVEVFHNGKWGTICDDKWDDVDAEVVCRQLGFGGIPKAWAWAHFGQGTGPIQLDAVQCTGNELSLEECPHGGWEQHNCDHMEDAGVSCSPFTDGVVRLVGADIPWEGRLEVYHNGDWGTVCSNGWTELHARVVCRQLGFRDFGSVEKLPDDVTFRTVSERRCSDHLCSETVRCHMIMRSRTVSAIAMPGVRQPRSAIAIRAAWQPRERSQMASRALRDEDNCRNKQLSKQLSETGSHMRGRAEVAVDGAYGEGSGLILLDGVRCSGAEHSLLDCSHTEWGRHECTHRQDVALRCERRIESNHIPGPPPATGMLVRLVGGQSRKEGRVEVLLNGQWGSVCDDGWNDLNAAVVCRQLGFRERWSSTVTHSLLTALGAEADGRHYTARSMAYFGEGRGPIHLDNIRCTGKEASLGECPSEGQDAHDCRHSEDAGVTCDHAPGPRRDSDAATRTCGLRPSTLHYRKNSAAADKPGEWPWQASLWLKPHSKGNHPLCSATLINSCWALTAAHCFNRFGRDPSRYMLRLGDYRTLAHDGPERGLSPDRIVVNRKYETQGWDHDIALVRLRGEEGSCVTFDPHTNAACLPVAGSTWGKKPATCLIMGWGLADSDHSHTLLPAWVPLLPSMTCKKRYGDRFSSHMLCAGDPSVRRRLGSCHGDSAGPLLCEGEDGRWTLVGVTSRGQSCSDPTLPGVTSSTAPPRSDTPLVEAGSCDSPVGRGGMGLRWLSSTPTLGLASRPAPQSNRITAPF
ncbi:hypothetical protein JZ751_008018 [Albula glossodonta]|uniref:Neurotrypsin n=1 Tax=Albula glossodonta TaxID=121402 RepID=A0A8T2P0T4_9TELE|nr:hypothetical protein JZ751_008018 [Albula glossodonta]